MIKKQILGHTYYECSACGNEIAAGSEFCSSCGHFVSYTTDPHFTEANNGRPIYPFQFNLETVKKSKEGALHYLKGDWLNFELSDSEKELYYALMPILRTERFLCYFFKLLNYKFYEQKGAVGDKETLLKYFSEGLTKILRDNMQILIHPDASPSDLVKTSYEWLPQFDNFGNDLNFFKDAVLDKLNFSRELREIAGISSTANVYQMTELHTLLQNFMVIAAGHAYQRLRDEIENENFFGLEVIEIRGTEHILLYQTPYGMLHYNSHIAKFDTKDRPAERLRLLFEIGVQKLESQKLHQMLDCHSIIAFNNKIFVQNRFNDDNLSSYISNKNNLPFLTLLQADLQVNYQLL